MLPLIKITTAAASCYYYFTLILVETVRRKQDADSLTSVVPHANVKKSRTLDWPNTMHMCTPYSPPSIYIHTLHHSCSIFFA